mmetsp:Transcript_13651/g.15662  ORF Transcript_13651/g.15662 Transcript_13651/m.15662 type:complete len:89 (+) Transcript_13651:105-371(+)
MAFWVLLLSDATPLLPLLTTQYRPVINTIDTHAAANSWIIIRRDRDVRDSGENNRARGILVLLHREDIEGLEYTYLTEYCCLCDMCDI